jgi:hypothetical protein
VIDFESYILQYPIIFLAIGIILILLAVLILLKFRKNSRLKRSEKNFRQSDIEQSARLIKFAENIKSDNITAATLFEEVVKTIGEREGKNVRTLWKSVHDADSRQIKCEQALRGLEKISDLIDTKAADYGDLGTTKDQFELLLDYFRENFQVT